MNKGKVGAGELISELEFWEVLGGLRGQFQSELGGKFIPWILLECQECGNVRWQQLEELSL